MTRKENACGSRRSGTRGCESHDGGALCYVAGPARGRELGKMIRETQTRLVLILLKLAEA